ncbi:hypothetical protein SSRG_01407 [Streptomyces griseoflavus Tu4000]|uniref:Uncharacterized protein n=1 Tax=Streptomyces griseoflavus Tu4000 TaxID=467200 RepID=D9XPM9_9ACTN|nr:hypothetical protein SSRG_01407 [Streptomyces griseoflavus Tu4000]
MRVSTSVDACAVQHGTCIDGRQHRWSSKSRGGQPGARPSTSHVGDGPRRAASTCVNIDVCRMRTCCRCSKPTARVWRRAARR